jgi:GH18 family chitinase
MKIISIILFTLISLNSLSQRIIGYYPNYQYNGTNHNNIQWNKMTHLHYFSLNPTRDNLGSATGQSKGNLWIGDPYSWFNQTNFNNVVAKAKAVNPNIQIFICSGGATGSDTDLNQRFEYIGNNPSRLNTWCNNIINFIITNGIHGWDLDWEFPNTASARTAHANMLTKMRQKIDSTNSANCTFYKISIAVGGGYTDRLVKTCWNPAHTDYITQTAINQVDYFNIMTYDGNIGSAPCSFASHQHTGLVDKAYTDWTTDYTIPASKISIGCGFYNNAGTAFSSGGNNSTYYNQNYWATGGAGCPTLQWDMNYIKGKSGSGIIIWELTQDNLCSGTTPTCYSLLDCLYQWTITNWGTFTPQTCVALSLDTNTYNYNSNQPIIDSNYTYNIWDLSGRFIMTTNNLKYSSLPDGFYIIGYSNGSVLNYKKYYHKNE